jgi:hypothetical protein
MGYLHRHSYQDRRRRSCFPRTRRSRSPCLPYRTMKNCAGAVARAKIRCRDVFTRFPKLPSYKESALLLVYCVHIFFSPPRKETPIQFLSKHSVACAYRGGGVGCATLPVWWVEIYRKHGQGTRDMSDSEEEPEQLQARSTAKRHFDERTFRFFPFSFFMFGNGCDGPRTSPHLTASPSWLRGIAWAPS